MGVTAAMARSHRLHSSQVRAGRPFPQLLEGPPRGESVASFARSSNAVHWQVRSTRRMLGGLRARPPGIIAAPPPLSPVAASRGMSGMFSAGRRGWRRRGAARTACRPTFPAPPLPAPLAGWRPRSWKTTYSALPPTPPPPPTHTHTHFLRASYPSTHFHMYRACCTPTYCNVSTARPARHRSFGAV